MLVSLFYSPQSYFGPPGTVKDFDAVCFIIIPSLSGSFSLIASS